MKLYLTIWTLANQETYRQIADRFGLSRGYAHYIVTQSCGIIRNIASTASIVKWPDSTEIQQHTKKTAFQVHLVVTAVTFPSKLPLFTQTFISTESRQHQLFCRQCVPMTCSSLISVLAGQGHYMMHCMHLPPKPAERHTQQLCRVQ